MHSGNNDRDHDDTSRRTATPRQGRDNGSAHAPGDRSRGRSPDNSPAERTRSTRDPRAIIPGNPEHLYAAARRLGQDAKTFDHHGARWRGLNFGNWEGTARDAAAAKLIKFSDAQFAFSDRLTATQKATTAYADALAWGQREVRDALAQLDQADRLTSTAPSRVSLTDNDDGDGTNPADEAEDKAAALREDANHRIRQAKHDVAQAENAYIAALKTLQSRPEGLRRLVADPQPSDVKPPPQPRAGSASYFLKAAATGLPGGPATLSAGTPNTAFTAITHHIGGMAAQQPSHPTPDPHQPTTAPAPPFAPGPPPRRPSVKAPPPTASTGAPPTTPRPSVSAPSSLDSGRGSRRRGSGGTNPSVPSPGSSSGDTGAPLPSPDISPTPPPASPSPVTPSPGPVPPTGERRILVLPPDDRRSDERYPPDHSPAIHPPPSAPVPEPHTPVPPAAPTPTGPDTDRPPHEHTPTNQPTHPQPEPHPHDQQPAPGTGLPGTPSNPLNLDNGPATGVAPTPPDPAHGEAPSAPGTPEHHQAPPGATSPDTHPGAGEGSVELSPGVWIPLTVAAAVSGLVGLHALRRRHAQSIGRADRYPDPTPTGRSLRHAFLTRTGRTPHGNEQPTIRSAGPLPDWIATQSRPLSPWSPDASSVQGNAEPVHLDTAVGDDQVQPNLPRPGERRAGEPRPDRQTRGTWIDIGETASGHIRALNLAATAGIGIYGPAAGDVLRSIVITTLSSHTQPNPNQPATGQVLIPARDALELLGVSPTDTVIPAGLRITHDLDSALRILETAYSDRADNADPASTQPGGDEDTSPPPLVLILNTAPTDPTSTQRLHDILAATHSRNETPRHNMDVNITVIGLGTWLPGANIEVAGTPPCVVSARGAATEYLRGARIYTLPAVRAAELLTQLTHPNVYDSHTSIESESPDAEGANAVVPVTTGPAEATPASSSGLLREIGIRRGHPARCDLAALHGLGLHGPGGAEAARALLVELLGPTTDNTAGDPVPAARVVMPEPDAASLLNSIATTPNLAAASEDDEAAEAAKTTETWVLPSRLSLTDDLNLAVSQLECEILRRAHEYYEHTDSPAQAATGWEPLVLIAHAPPHANPSLRSRAREVIERGADLNITAIFLGRWDSGTSCHVDEHGYTTTNDGTDGPGPQASLTGTQLYTLPTDYNLFDYLPTEPAPDHQSVFVFSEEASSLAISSGVVESPALPSADPTEPDHTTSYTSALANGETGSELDENQPDTQPDEAESGWATGPLPTLLPGSGSGPISHAPNEALLVVLAIGTLAVYTRKAPGEPLHDITSQLSKKQRLLLGCLAAHTEPIPTDTLLDMCWPTTVSDRNSIARLHSALYRLRSTLRDSADQPDTVTLIARTNDRYHYNPQHCWIDQHSLSAHPAPKPIASDQHAEQLSDALELYTGALLDGLEYDAEPDIDTNWLAPLRENTRHTANTAAQKLAEYHGARSPNHAAFYLAVAIKHDPVNESLARQLIRHHLAHDQPDAARHVYTELTRRLTEIDLQPEPATANLFASP